MSASAQAPAPHLTVVENVLLGREPRRLRLLDRGAGRKKFAALQETTGFNLPMNALVGSLSLAMQQQVEILRALAREARLIIDLIDRLRARGDIAIVMIAHNYAQTLEICDRVMLVQHGEVTFESRTATTSAEELLDIVRREYRAARAG